jgi:FMN-dependent NADH-azoreductase
MAKILHIKASPRAGSLSTLAAEAYLAAHLEKHPGDTVETLDVFAVDLPAFDGATLDAKYAVMSGQAHSPDQAKAWGEVVKTIEHFKSFDAIVVSAPMWNFGVPYALKHYLDVIAQPGQTFGWSPEKGYFGLVLGKPVTLFTASAGDYRPGSGAEAIDFTTPYLEWIFRFFGFADLRTIRVAPTAAAPEVVEAAKEAALKEARALAA